MNKLKEINGKYYQEVEVVMLATDKNLKIGDLGLSANNILWNIKESNFKEADVLYECIPQHLYFLSNEEIKESCWCINKNRDTVYFIQDNFETANEDWDKIIATTDKDIQALKFAGTKLEAFSKILKGVKAQPSKEFIQAFTKSYNEGKPITKVLVEYDVITLNEDWSKRPVVVTNEYKLKVNSSNEITIKKVKDSYTREELRPIFLKLCHDTADYIEKGYDEKTEFNIDKWIEENL